SFGQKESGSCKKEIKQLPPHTKGIWIKLLKKNKSINLSNLISYRHAVLSFVRKPLKIFENI
ncbi:MAG: hypothetical protein RR060_09055, partial [Victivallaceae bacterium]